MSHKDSQSTETEDSDEEEFDYGGGELVFNGIIRTDVRRDDPESLKDQVLDKLPPFKQGSPSSEGSGSIGLDLQSKAEDASSSSELQSVSSDILGIEYRYEDFPNEPVEAVEYEDGEARQIDAYPRKVRSVFIYWDYPRTMFVQGAQTRVEEVAPQVNSALGEDVEFSYHEFSEEFLLWLVLKDKHSEPLASRITIEELSSTEITGGDPSDFGRDAEVEDSDDIAQSLPILAGILKDMDFAMLEGDFLINGFKVNAKIYSDGRVRLYANRDLSDASKLDRVLISNLFLSELMEEYRQWEDLPDTEKYPHPRYFKELHDEANEHGANFSFGFTPLVHRYAELRDEDPRDYSFEFEIYEPSEDD